MTKETQTYLIKVWDNIQNGNGSAKNIFTVVGVMKRKKDKEGNFQDEFMLYPAKGLAITGQASIQPYVKNGETSNDVSEDAEETKDAPELDDTDQLAAE